MDRASAGVSRSRFGIIRFSQRVGRVGGIPYCHYYLAFDSKTKTSRFNFIEKHKFQMDRLERSAMRKQRHRFIFLVGYIQVCE